MQQRHDLNSDRVGIFVCHETVFESDSRGGSCSFLLLKQFDSMLSTHSSAFDRCGTPTSVNSMSRIFMFLFISTHRILRIHSHSGNLCLQWFFIFVIPQSDVFTVHLIWFDVITNWCHITIKNLRWTHERALLCHACFPTAESCSQDYWFLWVSRLCSGRN